MDAQQIRGLKPRLDHFLKQFDDCFSRRDTRSHLQEYVGGQLSDLQEKSVAPIAHLAGVAPRSLQEFLTLLRWNDGRMRDRVEEVVAREYPGPHSVGLIDETSFVKKGDKTPGVKRQWCGVVGKTENCIVTVHLGYAVRDFHCLLDGELFLPKDWAADRERCRKAGIPDTLEYRPKWQIALELYDQGIANGIRFEWLTFDEGYGSKPGFLRGLVDRHQPFVGEVPRSLTGWIEPPRVTNRPFRRGRRGPGRKTPRLTADSPAARRVDHLLGHHPQLRDQAWRPYRVKDGERGPMIWEVKRAPFYAKGEDDLPLGPFVLLIARNVLNRKEIKFFIAQAATETKTQMLLLVGFSRWHIERCFEDGKGEVGLADYEGRWYPGLIRHLRISAVSYLFLAMVKETWAEKKSACDGLPGPGCLGGDDSVLVVEPASVRQSDRRHPCGHRRETTKGRPIARQPQQENPQNTAKTRDQTHPSPSLPVGHKLALSY